ncbi:MAG: 2-hydroxychromene-2-carboxylate isomerase [Betaproteobacteria bacterium]
MDAQVDYYLTPISPFVYLGHARFVEIARRHHADVAVKPVNLGQVFPVSGGLPLSKRAPQRQAYRLVELARWSRHLQVPLIPKPAHFPASGDPSACWVLAAAEVGTDAALALCGALGRALWAEDRDIADAATIRSIAAACGQDADALEARALAPDIVNRYAVLTQEAIDRGVFGAPTYVYQGELFWGQDRLDFLDRALAK